MKSIKITIPFRTLCRLCKDNGANSEEYGRLCPPGDVCLAVRDEEENWKKKSASTCPVVARYAKQKKGNKR